MAKFIGAVRFNDGVLMYFIYDACVDVARPALYATTGEADAAWDVEPDYQAIREHAEDVEPVDVIPIYDTGDVAFRSRASRSLRQITGPRDLDSANRHLEKDVFHHG